MNIEEISPKEILTYNHHDHLHAHKFPEITDIIYENSIRVITSTFDETKKDLQRAINPDSIYDRQFYFLSGYAGNGKTSFIYWFKKEIEKDNYYFEIINLIEHPQRLSSKYKLIMRCIIDKIVDEDFLKMRNTFLYIQNNREKFIKVFNSKQLDAIRNLAQENQKMFKEKIQNELDNEANSFDFTNVLTLYLFHKVQQFRDSTIENSKKSYTFCFDNLDELSLEFLSDKIWYDFHNAVAHLYDISDKIQCEFIRQKIYFVLVFREVNFACHSAQAIERMHNISGGKRFIFSIDGQDILSRRKKFMELYNIKLPNNLKDLLNIMLKEDMVKNIILPLLNYDFRTFSQSLLDILDPSITFINLSEEEYDNLSKFRFGRRGIIVNAYINYLAHNGFLKRITNRLNKPQEYKIINGGHWNTTRLVLTVFSNLSFPRGYPRREKELREIPPQPFDLLDAFNELKFFLTIDQFFYILQELTNITKFHWAQLITIYNKEPLISGEGFSFDFKDEKRLLSESVIRGLTDQEIDFLRNIKITLNASAYIYLRHIFTHFEYISAYKVNYDLTKIKPLFQCIGTTTRKRDKKNEVIFEFQERIEDVYNHVAIMCQNIREFYQIHFMEKGISGEDYIMSNYVFKGDAERNVLFFDTRMLSTHIRYIENFRHYVRKNYDSIIANASKFPELKKDFNTVDKTQNYFFVYIEKYITLMREVKDPNIGLIPNELLEKLNQARENFEVVIEINNRRKKKNKKSCF